MGAINGALIVLTRVPDIVVTLAMLFVWIVPLLASGVLLAALVRALLPMLAVSLTAQAWQLSALLWILAFSAFLWRYLPILTRPRIDNKSG